MVAANPLTAGKWSIKKFNATVINDIWPEVLFFTLVAAMVSLVSEMRHSLAFSSSLLTVLGTVLGLVISFRTSSAVSIFVSPHQENWTVAQKVEDWYKRCPLFLIYDIWGSAHRLVKQYERYQEGRKLWTNIAIASRNLGQLVWIHVPVDRADKINAENSEQARAMRLKAVIEKKSMVNLVQAFSVSVKHFLRGEGGIYYEDLYPIVSFLPRYSVHPPSQPTREDTLPMWSDHEQLSQSAHSSPRSTPSSTISKKSKHRNDSFDPEKALPQVESEVPLRGARNPPKVSIYDYLPLLVIFKPLISGPHWLWRRMTGRHREEVEGVAGVRGLTGKKHVPPPVDSNVPLEISLFLSSYVQWLLKQPGLVQPAIASGLVTNLAALQDTVANLERVRNTPIPFAYQAHLRMSLWIYLFFLPFQLQSTMHYLTIPATCFSSFLLIGFLEIGQEIENPFNYDANDLDMDSFCLSIQRELHQTTAHPAPDPHSYIFSVYNQPFAPSDQRSAEAMALDLDHAYHERETGMNHIRRTLLQNWRQVEEVTKDGFSPI